MRQPSARPTTVLAALAGSAIGARLVLALDERYIKGMLFIVLPVTAFFVLRKKSPLDTQGPALPLKKQLVIATLAAFIIGAYDGFYGPGTGTFLVLILTGLARMDVRTASGNTKCINLASNIAALVTFLINGQVFLLLGLCAALFSMCQKEGIHTALDTAGSIPLVACQKAVDRSDLVLLDLKAMDPGDCKRLTGRDNRNAISLLDYREAGNAPVWIRHVLVPVITL